jgi:hypothetical protein
VILATVPFALRVPRWQLLLRQDNGDKVAALPMWRAISIGFAANNTLPFRAGEVLRVMAISRLAPVSFGSALSSIAIERVLDALMVILLLGAALMASHFPPDLALNGGTPLRVLALRIGLVCLVALGAAIVAAWQRERTLALVRWVLPSNKLGYTLHAFAERVLLGLGALSDFRRSIPVIVWSLVIWSVNASALLAVFNAFDLPIGFTGALILQGMLMIGISVPQGPGFVGVFPVVFALTLVPLYQVAESRAAACGLLFWALTFPPIVLLGVYSAMKSGVHLRVPHEGEPGT